MNIVVYYLSITNNTKAILLRIKKGLEGKGHTFQLHDIRTLTDKTLEPADMYGFSSPVFGFREPKTMTEFLKSINRKTSDEKPCFLLFSYNGGAGTAFKRMEKLLKVNGFNIFFARAVKAAESYTPWKKDASKDAEAMDAAKKEGDAIANAILEDYQNVVINKSAPYLKIKKKLTSSILGVFMTPNNMRRFLGKINVNENKCTKCGLCAKICPSKAINLDPFPKISKACYGCCGCINMCPTDALDSKKTNGKPHYKGATIA